MVLFRIGGGATPLPTQPNPTYYGSSTTTTTKHTTPTPNSTCEGCPPPSPPPQTYPHPTPYIPPQPKEVTLGNNRYTFTVSTTTTPTTTLVSTTSSSSGGSTTPTTTPPSTGLSRVIEQAVAAMNTPPTTAPVAPPTVPLIPAFGEHFVGWAPWELTQQWGTAAELREFLENLLKETELRQQVLEEMAKKGLPVTPVPVVTEEETKRPIGLRVHYIPM